MNTVIEQLLQELYQADASLKAKEPLLRELLNELLAGKPQVSLDPLFRSQLKVQLLEKARQMPVRTRWVTPFSMMNKLSYRIGAVAVVVIALVSVVYHQRQGAGQFALAPHVATTSERAFGALVPEGTNTRSQSGGGGPSMGMGGGGGAVSAVAPMPAATDSKMVAGAGGGTSVAPEYYNYRYVYDGKALELPDATVQVLRRNPGTINKGVLSGLASTFDLGALARLKSFSGLGVQNITFAQDIEFGYSLYVDFLQGTVGINQNWSRWPQPYAQCREQSCYDNLRIKEADVPSDEQVIGIADTFMRDHGIALTGYGAGEIADDWRIMYARATTQEKLAYYFPEQVTVVYPMVINGMTVYEEGGMKAGIMVSVDVRSGRVSNVYSLATQQYDASSYTAITDSATILKAVGQGSWRSGQYFDPSVRTQDISVGEPTRALMRMWQNDPQTNMGRELLVPALVFPIKEVPARVNIWQKNIVIPLAKELFESGAQGGGVPMPLEKAI